MRFAHVQEGIIIPALAQEAFEWRSLMPDDLLRWLETGLAQISEGFILLLHEPCTRTSIFSFKEHTMLRQQRLPTDLILADFLWPFAQPKSTLCHLHWKSGLQGMG